MHSMYYDDQPDCKCAESMQFESPYTATRPPVMRIN